MKYPKIKLSAPVHFPEKKPESWQTEKLVLAKEIVVQLKGINSRLEQIEKKIDVLINNFEGAD